MSMRLRSTAPRARRRELTEPDLRLMRRIGIGMFVLGGLDAYALLLVPKPDTSDLPMMAVLATLLLLGAAIIAVCPLNATFARIGPLYGITIISAMTAVARPMGTLPFFYLWPVVIAAYFLPRREVVIAVAWMTVTYGIALVFGADVTLKMIMFEGIVSTVSLMAAVVVVMREHQERLVEQLRVVSTTDSLTGLLNRRAFESVFEREVGRAHRTRLSLSVVCFDLDHFKDHNDRHGHAAGDRVLRDFAALLRARRRGSDVVARIGGEEFVLLLFDTPRSQARQLAEDLGRELLHTARWRWRHHVQRRHRRARRRHSTRRAATRRRPRPVRRQGRRPRLCRLLGQQRAHHRRTARLRRTTATRCRHNATRARRPRGFPRVTGRLTSRVNAVDATPIEESRDDLPPRETSLDDALQVVAGGPHRPGKPAGELTESDLRLMARIGIGMFVLGALNMYASFLVPKPDTSDRLLMAVLATLLLVGAVVVAVSPPRLSFARFGPLYGITIIGAMAAGARPMGTIAFFYLWPVVIAAYFLPRREVVIALAWMTVSYGIALAFWADVPVKVMMFQGIVSTVALMAAAVVVMREHQRRLVEQLRVVSTTDSLTGLLNRRAFESAFEREVSRAHRTRRSLSVVCFDLDHFKDHNDRHGHAAGDRVLRQFAALLYAHRRGSDIVARIGGEEFVLLLFDTPRRHARQLAEDLGRELLHTHKGESTITFSGGIAELGADTTPDQLLLAADHALYAAKAAGRACVACWESPEHITVGPHDYARPQLHAA